MVCKKCGKTFINNYNRATIISGEEISVCPECGCEEVIDSMNEIHNLIGREVKIDDKEGEITGVLGTSYLKVDFFNVNDGVAQINVNDIDKYLVQRENIAEVDTLVGDPEVIQRKNCEIYSASGKSRFKEACELYKKIMKSTDTKDIDNITDINMAKQIIKMLVSDINRMHMEAVVSNGKME